MENKKKKNNDLKFFIISIVVIGIMLVIVNVAMKSGISFKVNSKDVEQYNSLNELKKSVSFSLDFPEFVESEKCTHMDCIMGQLVEVGNDTYALKAASFIDYNADPLGLYGTSSVDNKYTVNKDESGITFFRYRTGYNDYIDCTIINWVKDDTAYGVIYDSKLSENEALSLIGINNESNMQVYTEKVDTTDTECVSNSTILSFGNKYSVTLPEFKSEFTCSDNNNLCFGYINNVLVFVILYDINQGNNEAYLDYNELKLSDSVTLYYVKNNPFSQGTDSYNDYGLFIESIESISSSFTSQ